LVFGRESILFITLHTDINFLHLTWKRNATPRILKEASKGTLMTDCSYYVELKYNSQCKLQMENNEQNRLAKELEMMSLLVINAYNWINII
jgi:hypothetical protein